MSSNTEFDNISFDLPKNQSNVIKVIGVGGGGSNAINHMFSQGIKGVDFVICNTDAQALENSPVPIKIQLGVSLTEGLGAGANPKVGEQSAVESMEEIRSMLTTNTKMIFITAGMGRRYWNWRSANYCKNGKGYGYPDSWNCNHSIPI